MGLATSRSRAPSMEEMGLTDPLTQPDTADKSTQVSYRKIVAANRKHNPHLYPTPPPTITERFNRFFHARTGKKNWVTLR